MNTHRLQLLLDDETYKTLGQIRDAGETTYVAIIRRAVKMLDVLLDAKEQGCSVQIVDAKGKVVATIPVK